MTSWLFAVTLPLLVIACAGLRVKRYSRSHVVARLTIARRGLYVSRTPDGTWWKLRLRRRVVGCCGPERGDEPPDIGMREPRRPRGPGPASSAHVGLP